MLSDGKVILAPAFGQPGQGASVPTELDPSLLSVTDPADLIHPALREPVVQDDSKYPLTGEPSQPPRRHTPPNKDAYGYYAFDHIILSLRT
jgi:hypothetical protein